MGVLTDHIREYPDHAVEALEELGVVLRSALKSRKIANPQHLGFTASEWNDRDRDELLIDCYDWSILSKLNGLKDQLKRKPNVDQIIAGNVFKFLSKRQKDANPIRYVSYVNCVAAIEHLAAEGTVFTDSKAIDSDAFIRLVEDQTTESTADSIAKAISNATGWTEVTSLVLERKGDSVPIKHSFVQLIPKLTDEQVFAFFLRSLSDGITAICMQKAVEIRENQTAEKNPKKKTSENRILGLDLGYLDIESGDVSPWIEKLNDLRQKVGSQIKSKKVAARLEQIVDILIETVEQKTDIEQIGWPEIGKRVGISRQRIYEDRDGLIDLLSGDRD